MANTITVEAAFEFEPWNYRINTEVVVWRTNTPNGASCTPIYRTSCSAEKGQDAVDIANNVVHCICLAFKAVGLEAKPETIDDYIRY